MQNEPITAYLNGGLGNQLFGWAAAYEISVRNHAELILNISNLNKRVFGLGEFNLDPYGISTSLLKSYEYKNVLQKRLWILRNQDRHYFEKSFEFCEEVSQLKAGISIHGYFQSPRYFQNSIVEIRRQLTLKKPSTSFLNYEREMKKNPALIIHVRRGDYSNLNSYHKVLGVEYYQNALSLLPALEFKKYIFTDDLQWAQEIIGTNGIYITSHDLLSQQKRWS